MFSFKQYIVIIIILTSCLQYTTATSWYLLATTIGILVIMALGTYDHDYWERRGIYAPPAFPLVGHILPVVLFKEQGGMCFKRIYDDHKDLRFLGTHQFYQRTLVVRDPELIKRICVNDFQCFVDRGFFFNKEVDPLAGSVLFLRGNEWKRLRAKISPIFSPNKLRGMFPLIENTANEFVLRIKKLIDDSQTNNVDGNYQKLEKIISKDMRNKVLTEEHNQSKQIDDNYCKLEKIISKDMRNKVLIDEHNQTKQIDDNYQKLEKIISKDMRNKVLIDEHNQTKQIDDNYQKLEKIISKNMRNKVLIDEHNQTKQIDDNYQKLEKIISKDMRNKVLIDEHNQTKQIDDNYQKLEKIISKDMRNKVLIDEHNQSKQIDDNYCKLEKIISKEIRNKLLIDEHNQTKQIEDNCHKLEKIISKDIRNKVLTTRKETKDANYELKQAADENGNSEMSRHEITEKESVQNVFKNAKNNINESIESSDHNFKDNTDKMSINNRKVENWLKNNNVIEETLKNKENPTNSEENFKLDDEKRFNVSYPLKRILSSEAVIENRVKEIVDFLENKQTQQLNHETARFKSLTLARDKQESKTYDLENKVKGEYTDYNNIHQNTLTNGLIENDKTESIHPKLDTIENRNEIPKELNKSTVDLKTITGNPIKTTENSNKASEIPKKTLETLDNLPKPQKTVLVDSEKLVGGYTADAIVPCAFGLKSNVMDNENDPFAVALHAFYEMTWFNIFEKTMRQFWPAFVLFFRMRIIPKTTHDFFHNIVTSVLRARENGEQEKRGDFIDMMMALRSNDKDSNSDCDVENDVEITDMVISANAFIIFLGGFETTSSTLAFLLLELAANPRVQDALRHEIHDVLDKHGGTVSYEVLQEMTYMDTVIQETLRLYPPFPSIQRMCTKDYRIPGSDAVVEKGTIVLFPTLGIHRDEQYFKNAGAFNPERWSSNKPPPPGVYMPFGDGPRYCIGKRFALIQMKCCLIRLLQHVKFSPASDAARTGPFAADPRSPLTLHPADSRVKISLL